MGYRIEKRNKEGWRLVHKVDRGNQGTSYRVIPKGSQESNELGFRPEMPLETAKRILEAHYADNKRKATIDKEANRKAKIEGRLKKDLDFKSSWLPKDIINEFEVEIFPEENLQPRHWEQAQALICAMTMDPSEWAIRKKAVWQFFLDNSYSIDYTRRILRAVNLYMRLFCRRLNKFWIDVPPPDGKFKTALKLANRAKRNGRQEPRAMTLQLLALAKQKLPELEYNWLAIEYWFGLRVEEVDQITPENRPTLWYVQKDDPRFQAGLWIVQMKLVRVDGMAIEDAWKCIPALEKEQLELIPLIESGTFKKPVHKTVIKNVGPIQLKSGRTGFTELMISRGYSELIASKWLGHKSVKTTRSHYQQNRIGYVEVPMKKEKE